MEDYTYHFDPANAMVLGSHMLEVDASLAASKPKLEVHPLGIGGKAILHVWYLMQKEDQLSTLHS